LHPLRVESVAWVTERKDVLSTFFWMLTLWAYAKYVEAAEGRNSRSGTWYGAALTLLALGLMTKAMLVTVPCVLLLLDYWPLGRFQRGDPRRMVREKIPFFALAAAASVTTFVVQKQGGAVIAIQTLPLGARCGNALISYCRYLGKFFWPADLAVFYPHPGYWPIGQVLLASGLIAGISMFVLMKRRQYPFLLVGWLWYCGTLVPVIQLVQSGEQAMADRFTYVPSLGLLILVLWGTYELTRHWRYQVMLLSATGSATIVLCLGLTRQQLGYWKDSETLFRHALKVTRNNQFAHKALGNALLKEDQIDEAIRQFQEAIPLKPNDADNHYNLGNALLKQGQTDEAIRQFQEVVHLKPDDAEAHNNLGNAFLKQGQIDQAIRQFQEVIHLKPDDAEAHNNLATALGRNGQIEEGINQFKEAIRLKPDDANIHYNFGNTLLKNDQIDEAIRQYKEVIHLNPDDAEAHNNFGIALGRKGQIEEGIHQFQEAIHLKPDYADAQNNLARALKMKDALPGR